MKTVYELTPDSDLWGNKYEIIASHKWGLPGVICPTCQEPWINIGPSYPTVDLTNFQNEKLYRQWKPVPLDEFLLLVKGLQKILKKGTFIRPATDLGPLIGKVKGIFGDFAWPDPWTLLIRKAAMENLSSCGVQMPLAALTELKYLGKNKDNPDLLELQIEPYADIILTPKSVCKTCGREDVERPEKIIVDGKTIPEHVDVFRGRNFTTLLFANKRFVDTVKKLQLRDILFKLVEVTGS